MAATEAKVTRNGQVSLPAVLRHRWAVDRVLVIDRGDDAIVRPIPDDVVAALRGSYAGTGPTAEEARSAERASEAKRDAGRSAERAPKAQPEKKAQPKKRPTRR
jgi:bifunctional DNA-binding transcriptional regulator/antitoxin component of YhaV-PrlF toxin-antitoxin module